MNRMEFIGEVLNDLDVMNGKNELVIVGAGTMGKQVFRILEEHHNTKKLRAFCDNNNKSWSQKIEGVSIWSIEETVKDHPNAIYLLCSKYVKELTYQLNDLGIHRIHLIKI